MFQTGPDVLGDNNAVVDQQAQRNDRSRDRHPLQFNAQKAHDNDTQQHGQRDKKTNDQAGADAQKKQHHCEDDPQGLIDVGNRALDGGGDQTGLIGGILQHIADGQFLLNVVDQGGQSVAEFNIVGPLQRRDGKNDRRAVIEERRQFGRINQIPPDRQHFIKAQHAVRARDAEHHGADFIDGADVSGRFQQDGSSVGNDFAARFNDVLLCQGAENLNR